MLHAQGVDSTSFFGVAKKLSKHFHIYCVDCLGHGIHAEKPKEFIKAILNA